VTRITSSYARSYIVTSHAELNVWVYDFNGDCIFGTSFWATPEVLGIFDEAPGGLPPNLKPQQLDVHINGAALLLRSLTVSGYFHPGVEPVAEGTAPGREDV
jgi:hypothetical protein